MKKNKISKTILAVVLFFALSTSVFAQLPADPDPTFDDPGAPLEPTPIGDYILPMLVLGIATAYFLLRKKTASALS